MNVDIYIKERNGDREIRIPWLPEKIHFESGGTTRITYDIMNRGPVEVPTGSGLCAYSWESEFPGPLRTDMSMMRGDWMHPRVYHNILEDWRTAGTPLTLMVAGYPINKDVILDDYNGDATGAFGDIVYEVRFIEDRDITIQVVDTSTQDNAQTKRQTTQPGTYEVKKGDNLWKIAEIMLGKGSRHTEIYNLNKEIIESTARKYGKSSSNNGWWIYPSTKLQLPAK